MDNKIRVFRNGMEQEYFDALKYWCNACGELHHFGEYEITESGLPTEIKRAYNELWSENYNYLCYLVQTSDIQHGIALIVEYDEISANNLGTTMEKLMQSIYEIAQEIETRLTDSKIENYIYIGEEMGYLECHELVVILPATISKEEFEQTLKIMEQYI